MKITPLDINLVDSVAKSFLDEKLSVKEITNKYRLRPDQVYYILRKRKIKNIKPKRPDYDSLSKKL